MPKLIVMVGLPRSGKSTYARTLGFPIVNPDSIRLAFYKEQFNPTMEDWIWGITKVMVESLFIAGHETVILDATNTTRKKREQWTGRKGWTTEFHWVNTPQEICLKRANEIMKNVIYTMANTYEPPTCEEGIVKEILI